MTQYGIATVCHPPEGSTSMLHSRNPGVPEDRHGPCNAWNYMGGDKADMDSFGHINSSTRELINMMKEKLPKIETPTAIKVGSTGYWYKIGEIIAPKYAQTTDTVGRGMFFVGDVVIIQRYLRADTLIYYNRKGKWVFEVANSNDIKQWRKEIEIQFS